MSDSTKNCLFCNIPKERVVAENALAYVIRDGFPITEHHTLVIPKRHAEEYFALTQDELLACNELLHSERRHILTIDQTIEGFNIGMNKCIYEL